MAKRRISDLYGMDWMGMSKDDVYNQTKSQYGVDLTPDNLNALYSGQQIDWNTPPTSAAKPVAQDQFNTQPTSQATVSGSRSYPNPSEPLNIVSSNYNYDPNVFPGGSALPGAYDGYSMPEWYRPSDGGQRVQSRGPFDEEGRPISVGSSSTVTSEVSGVDPLVSYRDRRFGPGSLGATDITSVGPTNPGYNPYNALNFEDTFNFGNYTIPNQSGFFEAETPDVRGLDPRFEWMRNFDPVPLPGLNFSSRYADPSMGMFEDSLPSVLMPNLNFSSRGIDPGAGMFEDYLDPTLPPNLNFSMRGADPGAGMFENATPSLLPNQPDFSLSGADPSNRLFENAGAARASSVGPVDYTDPRIAMFEGRRPVPTINVIGGLTPDQLQAGLSGLDRNVLGLENYIRQGDSSTGGMGLYDSITNLGNRFNTGIGGVGSDVRNLSNFLQGSQSGQGAFDTLYNRVNDRFGTGLDALGANLGNRFDTGFGRINENFSSQGEDIRNLSGDVANLGDRFSNQIGGLDTRLFGDVIGGGQRAGGAFDTLANRFDSGMQGVGSQIAGLGNRFGDLNTALFGNPNLDGFGAGAFDRLGNRFTTGLDQLGSRVSDNFRNLGDDFRRSDLFQRGQLADVLSNQSGLDQAFSSGLADIIAGQQGIGGRLSETDRYINSLIDPVTAGQTAMFGNMSGIQQQIQNLRDIIPTLDQISDLIPNQPDMTDLITSGGLDSLANTLNLDFADPTPLEGRDWTTDVIDWSEAPESFTDPNVTQYDVENPVLEMPEIMDYTQSMRVPLIENVLSRVGGANPYDTRQANILEGQESAIDKNYDDAIERVKNQFAVTDDLGSPAYRAAIREIEEGRARDKSAIQSQFQMQAAGLDESMARGRLQDLSSALTGEFGRVQQEMAFQDMLQRQANQDYLNYINSLNQQYYTPQQQRDEGLRYALGGLGNTVQPNMAAATTGLGSAAGAQADIANAMYGQGGSFFNQLINQLE